MKMRHLLTFLFVCCISSLGAKESVRRISVADFGAEPNSRKAVNEAFRKALEATGGRDAVIVFPKGRYDFWQDFSELQTTAMELKDMHNITIDGQGSEFVFHGRMKVLHLENCTGITARNFSTDWDRPYITQAEFVNITPEYVDMRIDKRQYPYVIEDGRALFTGEGWSSPVLDNYMNLFNKEDSCISYRTRDCYTSNIFKGRAEELSEGLVRFYGTLQKRDIPVKEGQIIIFFHGTYILTGIEIARCKDTVLEDITLYHTLSNGVYGYLSENITLRRVSTTPRSEKGRVFSTVADASHFTCCRGHILIDGCAHAGQADDFMNVRGNYARIDAIDNPQAVGTDGRAWTVNVGDTMWVINKDNMRRGAEIIVKSVSHRKGGYTLSFTTPLPKEAAVGSFLENKTWTPSLTVQNCRFQKKNRARGMLVTTPKKVIIQHNYFNTAGAAILIEGDLDHWFESGAHTDLTIRNNVFENCSSSGCETGDRWEWGEAPITISPSYRPQSETSPVYHRNITIADNTFRCFDAPVVFARSVENLRFERNTLERTDAFKPFLWQKSNLWLDGCRKVVVQDNKLAPDFPAQTIEIRHMKRSDVKVSKNNAFKVIADDK